MQMKIKEEKESRHTRHCLMMLGDNQGMRVSYDRPHSVPFLLECGAHSRQEVKGVDIMFPLDSEEQ